MLLAGRHAASAALPTSRRYLFRLSAGTAESMRGDNCLRSVSLSLSLAVTLLLLPEITACGCCSQRAYRISVSCAERTACWQRERHVTCGEHQPYRMLLSLLSPLRLLAAAWLLLPVVACSLRNRVEPACLAIARAQFPLAIGRAQPPQNGPI